MEGFPQALEGWTMLIKWVGGGGGRNYSET
jgi:hypothetical protein